MNCSMEDYLKVIVPYLSSDLVSGEALYNIYQLTKILPSFSIAGFECRLGENQSRVDFGVRLPCITPALPSYLLQDESWHFLKDICKSYNKPHSFLSQKLHDLCLEFDLNKHLKEIPVPCIFLNLKPQSISSYEDLIQVVSKLAKPSLSKSFEANLQQTIKKLPKQAFISNIGAMLSRNNEELRINVNHLPVQEFSNYLKNIGWQGNDETLQKLVFSLSNLVDSIVLSFDVGNNISSRIGLECYINTPIKSNLHWHSFLDYLVQQKLCTISKKKGLLDWTGFSTRLSNPEIWPQNLNLGDRLLGAKAFSIFTRNISHIKIVYQPDTPLEVKAYFTFSHIWLDANLLTQKVAVTPS